MTTVWGSGGVGGWGYQKCVELKKKDGVGHKTIFNAKWLLITVTYNFGAGVMKAVTYFMVWG
jgi:hypothetical protein